MQALSVCPPLGAASSPIGGAKGCAGSGTPNYNLPSEVCTHYKGYAAGMQAGLGIFHGLLQPLQSGLQLLLLQAGIIHHQAVEVPGVGGVVEAA